MKEEPGKTASDRAFKLFADAYGRAWAPKPSKKRDDAKPLEQPPSEKTLARRKL